MAEEIFKWEPNEREQIWLDSHKHIRSYEVSIWTLQDDFITVLKPSHIENKGQIQDGKMILNVDGTQELTFSIPMYLYNYTTNRLEENPIWYNTQNGNIAIDMRKIKVIFDDSKDNVYEFLIVKVEERHTNDQLFCDVGCEGLAFHELGKVGYKISLVPDDFYNDDYDWSKEGSWKDVNGVSHSEAPIANIQYWLNKFLKTSSSSAAEWSYSIEMNYDAYPPINGGRSTSIIYEEEYPASWNSNGTTLTVVRTEKCKEKERLVELEESNIYNLTQNLAEVFEVFCKYKYLHDDNYHIIGRRIIFYNNFIYENEGYIDFTYPFSTSEITREMDSTDLVTKMFVKQIEDDTTASGLLTIIDTEANNSGEDYLLNFDYLHKIKAISEEQYAEISKYEARMKQLNMQIAPVESQIVALSAQLPTLEAKLKIASNAVQLDTERIGAASDLFNAITEGDGEIEVTAMNPATAVLLQDSANEAGTSYYINLSKHGIDASSVRIFRYFDVTKDEEHPYSTVGGGEANEIENHDGRLYVELKTGRFEYDEFGDVTKVRNLYLGANTDRKIVFLTYNYTPRLYYERVVNTWKRRLEKDQADKDKYEQEIESIKTQLTAAEAEYDRLLLLKKQEIRKFELMMGPALREGYWNPDDYKDCGDRYKDEMTLSSSSANIDHRASTNTESGKELLNYFLWDTEPFNNEQTCERVTSVSGESQFYPCINLLHFTSVLSPSGNLTLKELKERISELCFFFCDYNGIEAYEAQTIEPGKMRSFAVGSQCQYGFVKQNNQIIPVLILTGLDSIPSSITISRTTVTKHDDGTEEVAVVSHDDVDMMTFIKSRTMKIGALEVKSNGDLGFKWSANVNFRDWIDSGNYQSVYPRICITSLMVKTSSDQLFLTYAKQEIKNVEDYYCLSKIPNGSSEANYYITLKPETIFRLGGVSFLQSGQNKAILGIKYVISNADTAIYLDAKDILKENAYPRVAYTIKLSSLNREFMENAYERLCYIAHINDAELKFQNTMGYISQVSLNLDKPWEDEVEVKNYKTKFEDLFSTILASTEEMKKNGYALRAAASAFDAYGSIKPWSLEGTIYKVDLDYAFNQGNLTITENDGIWGVSESGVVAIRGGGIFTSTEQDGSGNWKWNTGITPEGINATLITAGQLDTNRVMVYAGDKLRFQLNGEGLFAYKSFFEDLDTINDWVSHPEDYPNTTHDKRMDEINEMLAKDESSDLDAAQFVKMDANGLFLIAKEGALVLNSDKTDYIKIGEMLFEWVDINNTIIETYIPHDGIERAAITWDGFSLKNYYDQKVLYADADTGNLSIKGTIYASELNLGGEGDETTLSLNQYIDSADKLIVEGLTTTNIAKFTNNVTTIYYVSESELINYLESSNQDVKQGKDGDIWYNIRSPKKELTVFQIKNISSTPRTRLDQKGDPLPHTLYDNWKMKQLEAVNSDFSFAKALMGIYQANIDGTKYNTVYKVAHAAAQQQVEVLYGSQSASMTLTSEGRTISASSITQGSVSPETLGADTTATVTISNADVRLELQDIPLEEQTPLLPNGITNNNLKFGDIWINTSVTPNAIYRWDADYDNEEEILNQAGTAAISNQNNTKGKWILLTNTSSKASQDRILYDLASAEGKVSRIAHGEYGLIFTDQKSITDIQLNKKVGLQIKSRDGAYFRVNSSQFGFVSYDGTTPYLYYEDGNLFIMGTIFAKRFYVLDGLSQYNFYDYLGNFYEIHTKISNALKDIFKEAGQILTEAQNTLNNVNQMNLENSFILGDFLQQAALLQPKVFTSSTRPTDFKPGDIWNPSGGEYGGNHYIAMSFSGNSAATAAVPLGGWNKVVDGSIASISGAGMNVDAAAGTIDMYAGSKITLRAKSQLDLASGDIQITGNNSINIGSKWVNIGSANGGINIVSTNIDENTTTGSDGKVNTTGVISKVQIDRTGLIMHSNKIELMAGDNDNVAAMRLSPSKGIWLGSNQEIRLFSGNANTVLADDATATTIAEGSGVLINKDKILYGVSSASGTTGAELTKDYIIFAAGNSIAALEIAGATPESTNTTGVKITKDNIWMATGTGNTRSLLKMGENGIRLGSTDAAPTGSYVDITQSDGITIAAGSTGSNAGSSIIIRPSELVMATAGTVQLYGSSGEITFGASKDSYNFKVTPDGDIYCRRIYAEEGFGTGVNSQVISTALWTASWTESFTSTYSIDNHNGTFATANGKLPGVSQYTVVVTLSGGNSVYFQRANVKLRANGGKLLGGAASSFPYSGTKTITYEVAGSDEFSYLEFEGKLEEGSTTVAISVAIYRDFKGSSTNETVQGTQGQDGTYTVIDTYSERKLLNFTHGWTMQDETGLNIVNYDSPTYLVYNTIKDDQGTVKSKTKFFETSVKTEYDSTNKYLLFKASETKFVTDNNGNISIDSSNPIADFTLYTLKKANWTSNSAIAIGTQEQKIQKQKDSATTWEDTGITTSLVSSWDTASHKYKIVADGGSIPIFETADVSGTWNSSTHKYSNTTTGMSTTLSGGWSGGTYTVKADTNINTGISTTVSASWGSQSTYYGYKANTYIISGGPSGLNTTIYGYQSGKYYYVRTSDNSTIWTDYVSATETVVQTTYPSLSYFGNTSYVPSSSTYLGEFNATDADQYIEIRASGTNVSTTYGYIKINKKS